MDAARIRAKYTATGLTLENNGHTIEAVPEKEQTLRIGTKAFRLLQFHFHTPSEHAVTGRRYPLEIHFVHQAPDGERVMFGVLVKRGHRSAAYAELGRLPRVEGTTIEVEEPVNVRGLMPRRLTALRYAGSLTTPPCSEGVRWNVAGAYIRAVAPPDPPRALDHRRIDTPAAAQKRPTADRRLMSEGESPANAGLSSSGGPDVSLRATPGSCTNALATSDGEMTGAGSRWSRPGGGIDAGDQQAWIVTET